MLAFSRRARSEAKYIVRGTDTGMRELATSPNPKTRRGIRGRGPEEAAGVPQRQSLNFGADEGLLGARLFFLVVKEPGSK